MQTTDIGPSCLAPVRDFRAGRGWEDPGQAEARARWCCEQLEEGRMLFFEVLPFEFAEGDRSFLVSQRWGDSRFHKNISYRPGQDVLRGFAGREAAAAERMLEVMRRYSGQAVQFLRGLLRPYASGWSLDYASFRPEAEQDRKLPLRKRNDLLHVDAFPSRPTHGGRILRCFTNINPKEERIWHTTEPFAELARRYAQDAGLANIAARRGSGLEGMLRALGRALGLGTKTQSPYDKFMLRFHDYLKENALFQQDCPKIRLAFPPGSAWIGFTDSVAHAVLSGQYAVEQTLIVPVAALVSPEKSPLRVLEKLAGRPLANGKS
ncbi:MAG TPA: Kdo hydroxylase family protein [Candidatus Acidoferrum sp.]|nr:Kdo hydroxylase family protein [Candidatus Acidoferrum sp.]